MIGVMFAGVAASSSPRVQSMDIHPAHRARHLRVRGRRRGAVAQPAADLPRRHDPRHRQLHGRSATSRPEHRHRRPAAALPMACSSWSCCSSPRSVWPSAGVVARAPAARGGRQQTTLVGGGSSSSAPSSCSVRHDRQQPLTLGDGLVLGAAGAVAHPCCRATAARSRCASTRSSGSGRWPCTGWTAAARCSAARRRRACAPRSGRCWPCPCCACAASTWPWPPWPSPCSWTTSSSQSNSDLRQSGAVTVGRPDIFGIRFATDRSFDDPHRRGPRRCASIGVGALRRGRFGRRLVAMSDSPAACSTVGAEPDRHQAGRLRLLGRPGRRWPAPSTAASAPRSERPQFQFLFSIVHLRRGRPSAA